jgi:hypothetical protein
MDMTEDDDEMSSGSGCDTRGGCYLSTGLGASGLLGLAGNHAPWWVLLPCSILALAVIALQTVMPQESRDRVSVLGMAATILLALLFRPDWSADTGRRWATKPRNRRKLG